MISVAIPKRNYQLVAERVAEILTAEFEEQALNYNTDFECEVYLERRRPIDETETGFVNVILLSDQFSNKHQGSKTGECSIAIDVVVKSATTEDKDGDSESQVKMQTLCAAVDYILEDPIYKYLGFEPALIGHSMVNEIQFMPQDPNDASNVAIGRLMFNVKVNESNRLLSGNTLGSTLTKMKLGLTNKGYQFKYEA